MSENETSEDLVGKLPNEIDGYTKRIMVLDNFVVIEYSKRQLFFRYINPDSFPKDIVEKYLLFDVKAYNTEKAVEKMKQKIKKYRESQSN